MWVISSDGKHLLDAGRFDVTKNLGAKSSEKWAIIAYGTSKFSDGGTICGYYPDKESAIGAIKKLAEFAAANGGKDSYYKF